MILHGVMRAYSANNVASYDFILRDIIRRNIILQDAIKYRIA